MGKTKRGLERGLHAGPARLPASLGERPALSLCTTLRKARSLGRPGYDLPHTTPGLDHWPRVDADLQFTTDLKSTLDRYLENTQAFRLATATEPNTPSFVEEATEATVDHNLIHTELFH